MCTPACLDFARCHLKKEHIRGKHVLEVGSQIIEGTLRHVLTTLGPASYLGVDLAPGEGVDEVCDVHCLVQRFGEESFDFVLCTEMMEHVPEWRGAIRNMKAVLRPGGCILLTAPAPGFRIHSYPHDYWRFEVGDLRAIFAEFQIVAADENRAEHGSFILAEKVGGRAETDLSGMALPSVITRDRVTRWTPFQAAFFHAREWPRWFLSILNPPVLKRIVMKRLRRRP